jgi:nicotinamidase-related amidase
MLDRTQSAVLVIDIQEGYRDRTVDHAAMVDAAGTLIAVAAELSVPILVTEQFPKGLGPTQREIMERLPHDTPIIEKRSMSCCGEPHFLNALRKLGRRQVVICGLEAHACVGQTTLDLLAEGAQIHLVYDAISARRPLDRRIGWEKALGAGALPASVESAALEWIRTAESPHFKAIHRLIK